MGITFDGKTYAARRGEDLKKKAAVLIDKGILPKMITFVDPKNEAAMKYSLLKQKAAQRIGAEIEIYHMNPLRGLKPLIQSIELANKEAEVHGVMVQLPLPSGLRKDTQRILNQINHKKDVDGLGDHTSFVSATVKAVLSIMDEAGVTKTDSILVVGSRGEVGKRLVKHLSYKGYSVEGVDKQIKISTITTLRKKVPLADVIISATGVNQVIKPEMVKQNAVVIDVGSPVGDVDPSVSLRTSFITPVPGGVGPVTVICLLENLISAASLAK